MPSFSYVAFDFFTNWEVNAVQNQNDQSPFAICMHILKWSLENEATVEPHHWGKSFAEGSPLWLCTWGKCTCVGPGEGFHFSRGRLDKVSQSTDWVREKKWELSPHTGQMLHFSNGDESWPLRALVMGLFPLVLCASNQKGRLLSARS